MSAGLRDPQVGRLVPRLALLQTLSALTEGVGLVLLVPLLGTLAGPDTVAVGPIAKAVTNLGFDQTLPALLALFVVLVAARAALVLARNRAALSLELALIDGLRQRAWRALLGADWRTLQGLRRSDQASLLITNLDRAGHGVNQLLLATTSVVTLLALALAALAIYPLFALGGLLAGMLVLLAYRRLRRQATALGEAFGAIWDRVYGAIGEALGALRSIKALGREAQAEAMVMQGFAELGAARHAWHSSQAMGQFLLQTGGAAVLALLVWLALAGWHLPAATILPLIAVFARGLPLLGTLQEAWQEWRHAAPALAAAEAQIAAMDAAAEPSAIAAERIELARALHLDGVTLHYAGQAAPALAGVSVAIPARQITALVGPSGAGKSSLVDLLAGLLVPDAGTIAVDEVVLDPAKLRTWRGQVAYIDQEPLVLAASVGDNLRWAVPAADELRLWQALEDAAAADFVRALPQRLETRLGDGGGRLSGGERQRLMLARALLRDPQLLILDEGSSALDTENEMAIAAALAQLRGRMTIVLIAHRGALLDLADHVIRLDSGQVVDES